MATAQTNHEVQHDAETREEPFKANLLDQVIERTKFDDPLANLLDPNQFAQIQRVAKLFAMSSLVPAHLVVKGSVEGTIANMVLVINQALRWNLDPFQVAAESYVVGGKLAFQGKLVAGVINSRCGLAKRLSYTFTGAGKDRTITVSGTMKGETEPRTIELRLGDAETQNAMWKKDPDQKLVYSGVVKWARRHAPEVMLGIMTDDDAERIEEEERLPSPPWQADTPEPPKTSRAESLSRQVAPPTSKKSTAKKTTKAEIVDEPDPEIDPECPAVPKSAEPVRDKLLKCKTSTEVSELLGRETNPDDEAFDALIAVGEWLVDTGRVKSSTPGQGSLID